MNKFDDCEKIPKSIPTLEKAPSSKSQKVVKLKDEWFYIAEADGSTKVFSIRLGIRLQFFPFQDRDRVFKWILSKIEIIKTLSNEF